MHTHIQQASAAVDDQHAKHNRNISLVLSGVALFFSLAGLAIVFGVVFGWYLPWATPRVTYGTSFG